jgi:hypothetical protein
MPFQMFVSGKGLTTIGTEHHFGSWKLVCIVGQKVDLRTIGAASRIVADNVQKCQWRMLQHRSFSVESIRTTLRWGRSDESSGNSGEYVAVAWSDRGRLLTKHNGGGIRYKWSM